MRAIRLGRVVHFGAALTAICVAGFAADAAETLPAKITAAVKNPGRPALQMAQDGTLKPGAVLAFAGIQSGQAVADLLPEGGYYTRLLSGIVGPKGRVYAVVPRLGGDAAQVMAGDGAKAKDPSLNLPMNRVERTYVMESEPSFKNIAVYWQALTQECGGCAGAQNNPTIGALSLPEQLDAVTAAYAYHVFKGELSHYTVRGKQAAFDMGEMDKAIYRGLKNGGTFLIIDNAAAKGADFAAAAALNRADPDAVKAEVLAAGFVLDGESTLLARSDDDHTKKAEDVLMVRGTSPADSFVLRFKKPLGAPDTDKRPKNMMAQMASYFGNTRANNAGAHGQQGAREHRTFFHADGTYEEIGRFDSGNNVFASGTWYWDADGRMCRHHLFQPDARDMADCNGGAERLGHKPGDKWLEDDGKTPVELMKGMVYFDE